MQIGKRAGHVDVVEISNRRPKETRRSNLAESGQSSGPAQAFGWPKSGRTIGGARLTGGVGVTGIEDRRIRTSARQTLRRQLDEPTVASGARSTCPACVTCPSTLAAVSKRHIAVRPNVAQHSCRGSQRDIAIRRDAARLIKRPQINRTVARRFLQRRRRQLLPLRTTHCGPNAGCRRRARAR